MQESRTGIVVTLIGMSLIKVGITTGGLAAIISMQPCVFLLLFYFNDTPSN